MLFHRYVWVALLLLLLLLCAAPVHATPDPHQMQAVRLLPDEHITLDGRLAHPAWHRAPVYGRFVEHAPRHGTAPVQSTTVQVLFDERALYVGITAFDTAPQDIRDRIVRADGVNRTQDFVVVYIDAIGQRGSAQFFRVNAAGSTADGMHTASDDSEDFAPDFDWDAAVARRPDGWTAVLRLPFASLRFAPGAQQDWRVMVARRLPREQFHLFTSVPLPREAPSFIARLQPLVGVELPQQTRFLTLRPSVTVRSTRTADAAETSRRQNDVDASLDIKWRPTASLLIDATLNPDFSQVELDVPQLAGNSRFALYLTEKRPFFFESADLLRSPTDALYTRSHTQPKWGLRATWRGAAWAGTAFAIDDRGGGVVLLPGPYGTGFAEQPAARSVAARVRSDDGQLQLGGIVAARSYAQDRGDNAVLGPDVAWQISDAWRLRGQWLHARTTALADDSSGQLRRGAAVSGDRVLLRALRQGGNGETVLVVDDIGRNFRHDSGFVNQAGTRKLGVFHSLGWHDIGTTFHSLFVNVDAYDVRDRSTGAVVQQVLRPGLWGEGARNLEWWVEYFARSAVRTASSAPLLHERYAHAGLVLTPAAWVPLVEANVDAGRLADTVANTVRPGARTTLNTRLRPLRALELEPTVSRAWLKQDGQRVYSETATQWLAVWHFDARHSLRAIVQRSALERRAEPGVAAESSVSRAESLTYAWRRSAGTRLFAGVTRARDGRAPDASSRTEAFVKLQVDAEEVGWMPL